MESTVTRHELTLTVKQSEAWKILMNADDIALCYGGAKGGGKSFLFCLWAYMFCQKLIKLFGINEPLEHPLTVGFIGRKRSIDFVKTTLETWKRIIPAKAYTIREQQKEIIIDGKVKVWFGGLDDQENINKFNSAELAFIAVDQAEETDETDLGVLEASLRLVYNNIRPPYKILYTANPAECHIKYRFAQPATKTAGTFFIPALPSDNKHLPEGYIKRLEASFSYDKKLLRAYRDGDWDVLMPTNQLITYSMIEDQKSVIHHEPITKKLIACDPSTGGDECVIKVFYNTKVVEQHILHERDTMKIAGFLAVVGTRHQTIDYAVDVIGIGKGIVDRLIEMGKRVVAINSSETADDPEAFYNVRAEIWAYVATQMLDKKLEAIEDEETKRQLVEVRYKINNSNGQLLLEPKEQTKKRLGRSPDRGDTYVYGIWALSRINANVAGEVIEADHQGRGEPVNALSESEYINIP